MKKKLKVYYTVQYVKEIELKLNEEHIDFFKNYKNKVLDELYDSKFYRLQELNEDFLSELPIPNFDYENEKHVEYVDNSFEINYFEK